MRRKNKSQIRFIMTVAVLMLGILTVTENPLPVLAAEQPVVMKSCKLNGSGTKLTVKAKVKKKTKAMGKKLYLLNLDANKSESGKKKVTPLASVKTKKGNITFKVKYESSMLYQKFVVAYKTGAKYKVVSDARYITNPEVLATYKGKGSVVTSKKGIQVEEMADSLEIGTKHAVINWTLNSLLNNNAINKTEFTYKGKTYYVDADQLRRNDEQVKAYNAAGVRVTIILLLPKDAASTGTSAMQYGGYYRTKFSSFNTTTKAGCNTFEAIMTYLAKRYGTEENLVSGWILGNEVNSASIWNYGGNKSLSIYMENYARAFRICYNAVKSVSKNAKVYISLDNNWNKDLDGSGNDFFSSKATVDAFAGRLKAQGDISFQIAYHAYPQGMSDPIFWDDTLATNSVNSTIISFKNINVLTKYAKKNFGKDCTIMLSEQSFNSTKGEAVQAAAYAYAYYISESNSMIEAFIYGREFDHPEEMASGYYWGLCDTHHSKRLIWSVFQYIDTADSFKFTTPLLKYTDLKKWTKISGFKKSKYNGMASIRQKGVMKEITAASTTSLILTWEKLNKGDGYEIYRDNVLVGSVAGNSTVTFTDENLVTGNTYQYQVRMYKEVPAAGDANAREKIYGDLSDPMSATVTAGKTVINEEKCEVAGNAIKIAWKKMDGLSGYEIYRSTQKDGEYALIQTVAGDKGYYKDEHTLSGTTYYYKVRAFATVNGMNYYGEFSEPTEKLALIKLTASIVDGKVVLNWTQWQDVTSYRIQCAPASTGAYKQQVDNVEGLTYSCTQYKDAANVLTNFVVGEAYYFRVRAFLGNKKFSEFSTEVVLYITDQYNPNAGTTTPETPGTEPTAPETPGTEPTTPEEPSTEETTPGTEPTAPETPGTAPTAPEVPGTEPTAPNEPGTEATAPEMPGTEPTAPNTPGTEEIASEVPSTEPTVPNTPSTDTSQVI